MRVNINGSGHQVEIQHDGTDLGYLIEKAQKLWDDTKPPAGTAGPAYGFSMERKADRSGYSWRLGDGEQPAVTAETAH